MEILNRNMYQETEIKLHFEKGNFSFEQLTKLKNQNRIIHFI